MNPHKAADNPLIIYPGGKWLMADHIVSMMPDHQMYVEPFAGAASVLFHKPRATREIVNDLDGDIVNLFTVLRDPRARKRLVELLELTPYARTEMENAYNPTRGRIEAARRMVVKNNMGRGKAFNKTGFRVTHKANTSAEATWNKLPVAVSKLGKRLKGVVIENKAAVDVIKTYDGMDTMIYVDPPYPISTRRCPRLYRYEMTDEQHEELAQVLKACKGMVILSGYTGPPYDTLGWHRYDFKAKTNANTEAVESVWVNKAVYDRQDQMDMGFV